MEYRGDKVLNESNLDVFSFVGTYGSRVRPQLVSWIYSHYNDVIMSTMASRITSLMSIYSTVYSGTYQRKHQSSASLAFVLGIHRWPMNSLHRWPVTLKMFPFDDVITLCRKAAHQFASNKLWCPFIQHNLIHLTTHDIPSVEIPPLNYTRASIH